MKTYTCIAMLTALLLLAGCAGLHAPATENINLYLLDAQSSIKAAPVQGNLAIAVSTPRAQPGYDTPRFAYVQRPHELNYYAVNRWADSPAHMLAPLLVRALEHSGGFRAVVQAPGPVPADIRLDTELIRLQQDFETHPSRVEITLRAQLIDLRSNRVLATRVFDANTTAAEENAYGGVIAANLAVQKILDQVTEFCMRESARRR